MIYTPRQSVELFHLLFLDQLGRKLDKKLYALKGGCNLRFYFNSFRYSEDIDLDIQLIAKETLQKKVAGILKSQPFLQQLKAKNIFIQNYSEPKQTQTTQRWKVQLSTSKHTLVINTKIEFSRCSMAKQVKFETINPELIQQYGLPPIFSNHYQLDEAMSQKLHALANRTETQARDIFDIFLLQQQGAKMQKSELITDQLLKNAANNIMNIPFPVFKAQVVAYLLDDYKEQYNSTDIWQHIQLVIMDKIESL